MRYRARTYLPRTAEVYTAIAELYRAGKSLDDIGLEYGCSGAKIGVMLREWGVELRRHGRNGDAFRFVPGRSMHWRPEPAVAA